MGFQLRVSTWTFGQRDPIWAALEHNKVGILDILVLRMTCVPVSLPICVYLCLNPQLSSWLTYCTVERRADTVLYTSVYSNMSPPSLAKYLYINYFIGCLSFLINYILYYQANQINEPLLI